MSRPVDNFQPYTDRTIFKAPQWGLLSPELQEGVEVVSQVLPFRTNSHVLERLIDWDNVPNDSMFRLTFPHRDMLKPFDYSRVLEAMREGDRASLRQVVASIRSSMNPHPAGQATLNIPTVKNDDVAGMQHKYRETVLFFPSAGQTCHAYCTFCFRWPQFVGDKTAKFSAPDSRGLVEYLRQHTAVSDVLITGGDPLVMSTSRLASFIDPLLDARLEHISTIRIGSKALAYWPQRFVTDDDSDDLLRLFDRVQKAGKHLSLMAHVSHPVEMYPAVAREAFRRVVDAGCVVRIQSPVLAHINDSSDTWARLWSEAVKIGAVPYYMFVERDTGAHDYFSIPLVRAYEIFRDAYSRVSGLARTVRGPSMSSTQGKVLVEGIADVDGVKAFLLKYIQARDSGLVGRPFMARFDENVTWFDGMHPRAESDKAYFL